MSNKYLDKIDQLTKEAGVMPTTFGSAARRAGRVIQGAGHGLMDALGHVTGSNVNKAIRQETKLIVKNPLTGKSKIEARPGGELEAIHSQNDSQILAHMEKHYGKDSEAYHNVRNAMNKKHAARVLVGGVGAVAIGKHVNDKMEQARIERQYRQTYGV